MCAIASAFRPNAPDALRWFDVVISLRGIISGVETVIHGEQVDDL